MAWNEPGGNDRDPWSGRGGGQTPPDLDEVVRKLQDRLGGLFGGRRRGGGNGGDSGGGSGPAFAGLGVIILLAVIVILGFKSFYIIQPAERGVIQRVGAFSSVSDPGPHLLIPFVDEVTVVDVDRVNKYAHRAQMLTKDENIVDLTLTIQYRIQDAADFLFQDADPENSLRGAMESALREAIGKSNLDQIITENRSGIADQVMRGTQELLDLYRTGVIVTNVNIQEANPPEAVKEAFDDATRAREDKERAQNQALAYANDVVPRARGAAARQLEDAKAYRARVAAEAEGESKRFLALLAEYRKAPEVTRERLYLDAVQEALANSGKVLLDTKQGANLTYLPLDKLLEGMPAAPRAPQGNTDSMAPEQAEPEQAESQPMRSQDNSRLRRMRP